MSMKKISKALITAAGFGSRFLPITQTIQKEMIPILNRPLIDYVVQDCLKAGIKEIIFVVNEHEEQIRDFYQENKNLTHYLKRFNKQIDDHLLPYKNLHAKLTFIEQKNNDRYGTTVPLLLAEKHLTDEEAFLVLMGDDFIYNPDQSSEVKRMIDIFNQSQADALVTAVALPPDELSKYGILKIKSVKQHHFLEEIIEKPAAGQAPSNLANISKYIFTPDIFKLINHQQVNAGSGELFITDSLLALIAAKQPIVVHQIHGQYLDGGNVLGWLKANLMIAKDNPSLYTDIKKFLANY